MKRETILIALGGNALIRKGQVGTIGQQFRNLRVPIRQIAALSRDYNILITHGNGPQVGNLLIQQESTDAVPKLPLEILVAQTQGQIGYMIESVLDSELMAIGVLHTQPIVTLLSYVVVDDQDPAFHTPTKPIGPIYSEAASAPYPVKKTAKGYRRVVASPQPITIVEKREIKKLIEMEFIVICCGGGGIPVKREGRSFWGVDAVIDKDLASAKLAEEIGVDIFMIATDENGVAIHYGTPRQDFLKTLTPNEADRYLAEGQFPPGTMGPKVEAAVQFIKNGGRRAVIGSIKRIDKAIQGRAGTQITAD